MGRATRRSWVRVRVRVGVRVRASVRVKVRVLVPNQDAEPVCRVEQGGGGRVVRGAPAITSHLLQLGDPVRLIRVRVRVGVRVRVRVGVRVGVRVRVRLAQRHLVERERERGS